MSSCHLRNKQLSVIEGETADSSPFSAEKESIGTKRPL